MIWILNYLLSVIKEKMKLVSNLNHPTLFLSHTSQLIYVLHFLSLEMWRGGGLKRIRKGKKRMVETETERGVTGVRKRNRKNSLFQGQIASVIELRKSCIIVFYSIWRGTLIFFSVYTIDRMENCLTLKSSLLLKYQSKEVPEFPEI